MVLKVASMFYLNDPKAGVETGGLISLLLGAVQEEREEEGVMVDAEQRWPD